MLRYCAAFHIESPRRTSKQKTTFPFSPPYKQTWRRDNRPRPEEPFDLPCRGCDRRLVRHHGGLLPHGAWPHAVDISGNSAPRREGLDRGLGPGSRKPWMNRVPSQELAPPAALDEGDEDFEEARPGASKTARWPPDGRGQFLCRDPSRSRGCNSTQSGDPQKLSAWKISVEKVFIEKLATPLISAPQTCTLCAAKVRTACPQFPQVLGT